MSDEPQGKDWWRGDNGKWYPPGAPTPDQGAGVADAARAREWNTPSAVLILGILGFFCWFTLIVPAFAIVAGVSSIRAQDAVGEEVSWMTVVGILLGVLGVLMIPLFALYAATYDG